MQYEFFQKMEAGTREAVEAKGWEFKLHDEKSDENEMVTGAQALLDQGVDVLIISPFKPDALGPIIAKAKQPRTSGHRRRHRRRRHAVRRDRHLRQRGRRQAQAAEYMDKQIQANGASSKKVVSITCEPSAVYAARRNEGFQQRRSRSSATRSSPSCPATPRPRRRTRS